MNPFRKRAVRLTMRKPQRFRKKSASERPVTGSLLTSGFIRLKRVPRLLQVFGRRIEFQIDFHALSVALISAGFAPIENVPASALRDVFAAVYNDHPELFFMETAYASRYKSNGECVEIDL